MRTWKLVLVGFGTVGRGVAERLLDAREDLALLGCEPRVVAVIDPLVGSVCRDEGFELDRLVALADAGEPLAAYPDAEELEGVAPAEIDAHVVVEMTPTNLDSGEPGLTHVREALDAGRHVITTNKGPIALAYGELRQLAAERGVGLRFEGTVLSGTPVLSLCEQGLAAAGIRSIHGIVNGTCNYILTEMEAGHAYRDALTAAQEEGYAEADPTADVEGWDAAAKVAILANAVLGGDLQPWNVEREGITEIGGAKVTAAGSDGECYRLVARVEPGDSECIGSVRPELVAIDGPLGRVRGADNLLIFDTEALGTVTISGPGAGRRATGHAVVSDLATIHRRFAGDA